MVIESKRDVGIENTRVDTRLTPIRHQIKILKNFQKPIDNLIKKCYNNNVNKTNQRKKEVSAYGKENHKKRNVRTGNRNGSGRGSICFRR